MNANSAVFFNIGGNQTHVQKFCCKYSFILYFAKDVAAFATSIHVDKFWFTRLFHEEDHIQPGLEVGFSKSQMSNSCVGKGAVTSKVESL